MTASPYNRLPSPSKAFTSHFNSRDDATAIPFTRMNPALIQMNYPAKSLLFHRDHVIRHTFDTCTVDAIALCVSPAIFIAHKDVLYKFRDHLNERFSRIHQDLTLSIEANEIRGLSNCALIYASSESPILLPTSASRIQLMETHHI